MGVGDEPGGAPALAEYDTEQLYGQIAIYTLLEHGAEEFDRLAEQVVEQVRAHEPDTLVYVVHGVPSAPLQRILYEIYRDQVAYDDHARQSYIRDFEMGRLPLVLATNVIELGVRQAKVSPLGAPAGSRSSRPPSSGDPLSAGRRAPGPVSSGPVPGPLPPGPLSSGRRPSGPAPAGPVPPGPTPARRPPAGRRSFGPIQPGPRSSGSPSSGPASSEPPADGLPYASPPGGRGRGGRPPGERAP